MPILTIDDSLLRPAQVAQPESTAGQEFGALFDEMKWAGLFGSRLRMEEIHRAEGTYPLGYYPDPYEDAQLQRSLSPLLTPEQGRAKLRDAGLSESLAIPEGGIRTATLDILIARKRAEQRRQSILSRPGASWPARLAGGLLGSLVDPSNVALAFVPVVGEAKYAAMLAARGGILGRTGIRVGVGAVEGTVGLLPGEALNYAANVQQQADYDGYDFMVSLAGGALFGSALHAGAGLFPEAIGRYRVRPVDPAAQPTPDASPLGGLADAAPVGARALDPAARERLMVLDRLADGLPVTTRQAEAIGTMTPELRAEIEADILARTSRVAEPGVVAAAKAEVTTTTRALAALAEEQRDLAQRINQRPNVTRKQAEAEAKRLVQDKRADLEARKQRAEDQVAANKDGTDAQAELSALRRDGTIPERYRAQANEAKAFVESLPSAIRKALDSDPYMPARVAIARTQPETQALAFRMAAAQALRGNPVNIVPAMLADPAYRDIPGAVASARSTLDQVDGADYSPVDTTLLDAVKRAAKGDDVAAIREATEQAEADVRESLASIGQKISDEEAEELAALTATGKNNSEAAKVASLCMMNTGG